MTAEDVYRPAGRIPAVRLIPAAAAGCRPVITVREEVQASPCQTTSHLLVQQEQLTFTGSRLTVFCPVSAPSEAAVFIAATI